MERLSLSLSEAAEALSVSTFTLRRQIKKGAIQTARVGRRVVIPLAELKRLVAPGEGTKSESGKRVPR